MEKLLAYLNSLDREAQVAFADSCKTSVGYLRKACSVNQELGAKLSVRIEQESSKAVTRADLHPEDWFVKWPELASKSSVLDRSQPTADDLRWD